MKRVLLILGVFVLVFISCKGEDIKGESDDQIEVKSKHKLLVGEWELISKSTTPMTDCISQSHVKFELTTFTSCSFSEKTGKCQKEEITYHYKADNSNVTIVDDKGEPKILNGVLLKFPYSVEGDVLKTITKEDISTFNRIK